MVETLEDKTLHDDVPAVGALWEMIDRVLALHRSGNAYITFARKSPRTGRLHHDRSFRADRFQPIFPQFLPDYLEDSYVGVNSSRVPRAWWPAGALEAPPQLKSSRWMQRDQKMRSLHSGANISRLNACFVDVDCNRPGFNRTPNQVLEALDLIVKDGKLPKPTTVIYSGGGVWILWHLHDPSRPNESHEVLEPRDCIRYQDINRKIGGHFAHLGADRGAIDTVRLTALHGSAKSKYGGKRVVWDTCPGGRSYTLTELECLVGCAEQRGWPIDDALKDVAKAKAPRSHQRATRIIGPRTEKQEWCARGHNRSKRCRLAHFDFIRSLRGKFQEGSRDNAAFIYARCLENRGVSRSESAQLVQEFGANCCSPKLSAAICEEKVCSVYSRRILLTYQTMADLLEVTVDEASQSTAAIGTLFPPRSGAGAIIPELTLAQKKSARHANIRAIHRIHGNIFSFQELLSLLAERGTPACKGTLTADFRELQIETPRMRSKSERLGRTAPALSPRLWAIR